MKKLRAGSDVQVNAEEAFQISSKISDTVQSKMAINFLKSLCCAKYWMSRRDKQMKVLRETERAYNSMCDVQSLIDVTLNQQLLLGVLLSRR